MITEDTIQFEYVHQLDSKFGAVATFVGVVRDHNEERRVTGIFYDCYREMAERELARIVEDIEMRLPVKTVRVTHRVGEVRVGEISMLVVVAAPHRREAFDGCHQIVEAIKERLPIWKKERYFDDTAKWL